MKKILAVAVVTTLFLSGQLLAQNDTKTTTTKTDAKSEQVRTDQNRDAKTGTAPVNTKTSTTAPVSTKTTTTPVSTNSTATAPADQNAKASKQGNKAKSQPGTITKSGSTRTQPGTITKSGSTGTVKTSSEANTAKTSSTSTANEVRTGEAGKDPAVITQPGMTSKTAVLEGQKFFDQQGNPTATLTKDGTIRDPNGRLMGTYNSKGEYINPVGEKVGYVENGAIRTAEGKVFARVSEDGRVYDGEGKHLGTIADDGTVLSSRGVRMGSAPGADMTVTALIYFFPKQTPLYDSAPVKVQ